MSRRTLPPRPVIALRHEVGDVLTVGSTRWLIRSIHDDKVVLEASSAPAGIVWTTTLDNLPEPMKETTP
ncbi:hypothetical protein [Microbacterium sp.]|uniref:hypothetical protein n=1 Tax=Microbacterium sp. TaxID=51671 RepID=UPI002811A8CC|nr:hypothetical protein [Microbacterium sp.]